MKRDNVMAMLMANHVIDMIKQKRAEEDALLKGNLTVGPGSKEHPLKEKIQAFFNNNHKAFGCERENVIKLMSALTGFEYVTSRDNGSNYYDQYSVVTSLVKYDGGYLHVEPGSILLVGSANGRVFNPSNKECVKSTVYIERSRNEARRATDEEYSLFMKVLETDEAKQNLATWMANNGIADCLFGLKLKD